MALVDAVRRVCVARRSRCSLGVSADYDTRLERGNLSGVSEPVLEAPTLWAAHNVRTHGTGTKRVHHPLVGELNLNFEAMELVADPGLTMFVNTA